MASEDVLSETMFTVWKDAPRFRGDSKPRTWLYRIARNKAIDLIRKRPAAPLSLVGDSNATARADDVDLRLSLEQALAALSPDHREVVELTFFHGLSYDEIARVVGCPVNTVKTRMFWAKRKLRALLNPPEAGAEEVTG
jgi:RNA polymerase sigma-70 factor (ECF subfamily)